MSKTDLLKIHPNFTLNGKKFTADSLKNHASQLIASEDAESKAIGYFLEEWLSDASQVTVSTSGSTGIPKIYKIDKQYLYHSAKATGAYFNLTENTTALLCLSANYIAGKMMLVRALTLGWQLDTIAPSNTPLTQISKTYDFCAMVPSQVLHSLSNIDSIKKLIIGGAPVSKFLHQSLSNKSVKAYETYGMTETVSHVAVKRIKNTRSWSENLKFRALPHVCFSQDDRNCLVIEAPLVAKERLVTNDMVTLLDEVTFIWKGRYDNVINSGGVKLFPEEIERKLQNVIANRFIISWLKDDTLGQKLILLVENEADSNILVNNIHTLEFSKLLDKFEIPKAIYFVTKFIETLSGKVHREKNRLQLVEKYADN